jgi:hypothetical protein
LISSPSFPGSGGLANNPPIMENRSWLQLVILLFMTRLLDEKQVFPLEPVYTRKPHFSAIPHLLRGGNQPS